MTYNTVFDKNKFIQNGGQKDDSYTLLNSAALTYGDNNSSTSASKDFKPDVPIQAAKKVDHTSGNTATWAATASTGDADRKDFTLQDAVTTTNAAAQKALSISDLSICIQAADGTETTYTPDTLPEDAELTAEDGNALQLGEIGHSGFKLRFDTMPAGSSVTVRYTTTVDRETYLANGGKDGYVSLKNAFHAGSADGYTASKNISANVKVEKPFTKAGKVLTNTSADADANPQILWSFDVNLTEKFTPKQLKRLKQATITDVLNPVLKTVDGSVTVTDSAGNEVPFQANTENQLLTIQIDNPAQHPNLKVQFKTECLVSVEGLTNSADLLVDGKYVEDATSPAIEKIRVTGQSGIIQSADLPVFTPTAWKYIDNKLCTDGGKYSFQLTEVDENGEALTGSNAYTDTTTNGSDGQITFQQIKFRTAGTHYYQIREIGDNVKDDRIFTVRVDVVKTANGYVTNTAVISPENYDKVSFDNTDRPKTTSFTVKKVWNDQNNASGMRPLSVVVHLYQDGKPYNNMAVTLNAENDWTYTWEDLPLAGGAYSAVEDDVPGYEGQTVTQNGTSTITNTVTGSSLTVRKIVAGNESDTLRLFTFTIFLKDSDGHELEGSYAYTGSKSGDIVSGEQITLAHDQYITIVGLPAGTTYSVMEKEANRNGYTTSASNTVGTVNAGDHPTAEFINRKGSDTPGHGQLSICKTVTGTGGDQNQEFTFTVTLKDALNRPLTGTYSYAGSKSGSIQNGGTILLKDGESVTISGLPADTRYEVVEKEANQNGYTTTGSNTTGTVSEDIPASAEFVNDKTAPPHHDSGSSSTGLTVKKVWEDAGSNDRPTSITVQCYQDGKAYGDPVELNDSNSWQYSWSKLSTGHTWTVQEVNVPDGYTSSISSQGSVWTITNKKDTPNTPDNPDHPNQPDKPDTPDQPNHPDNPNTPDIPDQPNTPVTPNPPATPVTPGTPNTPTSESNSSEETTPHTGDVNHLPLWICLFVCSGLALAVIVVYKKKKSDE